MGTDPQMPVGRVQFGGLSGHEKQNRGEKADRLDIIQSSTGGASKMFCVYCCPEKEKKTTRGATRKKDFIPRTRRWNGPVPRIIKKRLILDERWRDLLNQPKGRTNCSGKPSPQNEKSDGM